MEIKKLEQAVFAQGWLGSQIESLATTLPEPLNGQIVEQWQVLDTAMDALIRENRELRERLAYIHSLTT